MQHLYTFMAYIRSQVIKIHEFLLLPSFLKQHALEVDSQLSIASLEYANSLMRHVIGDSFFFVRSLPLISTLNVTRLEISK